MSEGIFVHAATAAAGTSLISLGLADSLYKRADTIGFFSPITPGDPADDPMLGLMRQTFDLPDERIGAAMSGQEATELMAAGRVDEIHERAVAEFSRIAANSAIVIVQSVDFGPNHSLDAATVFDLNTSLANNLATPVIAVVSGLGKTPSAVADAVDSTRRALDGAGVDLLAVLVNRADGAQPETSDEAVDLEAIQSAIRPGKYRRPVYVIPELTEVSLPTVAEVATILGMEQIAGDENLSRDVSEVKAVSMEGGNFLSILNEGSLVIVSGDRSDAVMGTLLSALSAGMPVPAGMILTNDLRPTKRLWDALDAAPFPVFATTRDTFSTAGKVAQIRGELHAGQDRKIAAALGAWHRAVDGSELLARTSLARPQRTTPMRFLHQLIERARADRKHIVLPEGEDIRILQAAEILARRDVCDLTVLGNVADIKELAASQGLQLDGVNLIDPAESELREQFAQEYATLRAHRGVDLARAQEVMLEGAYFGTMMVHLGMVDGMVSGAAHTTANTIRPALEFVRTRPDTKIVSSVFFMLLPDRALVYGDCAVNPNPNSEQLADIALASARTAEQFGVDPRVAMLSYSTGGSGSGEDVDRVREATELARSRAPELPLEGPIQYDAAVNASIAASKLPDSDVAGQATVFIFPDLNTGNNTYKAVQQSSGAVAVGPVLQGLNKPVNDLSRGCTVADIVNTVAITAIQAQG
ncbi:phosphate acetyltransferase [Micrococcoides hystricis]|uniref:Phosphate acetyltransferase n=1 Tax=Micrococcoides hystricis TaxID=1572761 RepID=A0ABV6PAH2_9MICC